MVLLYIFYFFADAFYFIICLNSIDNCPTETFYNSCFKVLIKLLSSHCCYYWLSFSKLEISCLFLCQHILVCILIYWILCHESLSFVYILGKRWYFCFSLWWAVGSYVSSFFRFCSTNCNCPAYTPSCGQPDTWVKIYLLAQFLKSLLYKLLSNTCMSVSHWFRSSYKQLYGGHYSKIPLSLYYLQNVF